MGSVQFYFKCKKCGKKWYAEGEDEICPECGCKEKEQLKIPAQVVAYEIFM